MVSGVVIRGKLFRIFVEIRIFVETELFDVEEYRQYSVGCFEVRFEIILIY